METGRRDVRRRTQRKLAGFALIILAGLIWLIWPGNVERLGEDVAEFDRRD